MKTPIDDTVNVKAIVDPTQIGFLNAVIDAMQGLAAVRTRDPKKGWVEFWVAPTETSDFMDLIEDLKKFIFIKAVDNFDGEEA